jgi:hypothetical protein
MAEHAGIEWGELCRIAYARYLYAEKLLAEVRKLPITMDRVNLEEATYEKQLAAWEEWHKARRALRSLEHISSTVLKVVGPFVELPENPP